MPEQADLIALVPGRSQVDVRRDAAYTDGECSAFLLYAPVSLPAGFALTACTRQTVVLDDGSELEFSYTASYYKDAAFPVEMSRLLVVPGTSYELVNDSPPVAVTLATIGGSPAVIRAQAKGAAFQGPFTVYLLIDDVVTGIEAAGIDVRDLVAAAEVVARHDQTGGLK